MPQIAMGPAGAPVVRRCRVLVHLGATIAGLAAAFGIGAKRPVMVAPAHCSPSSPAIVSGLAWPAPGVSTSTTDAHRYVTEMVDLSPNWRPARGGHCLTPARKANLILDGTLAPIDRLSGFGDRRYYSARHRRHGVHIQFRTDPHGELVWASPAPPGSIHDLIAARTHGLVQGPTAAGQTCDVGRGAAL